MTLMIKTAGISGFILNLAGSARCRWPDLIAGAQERTRTSTGAAGLFSIGGRGGQSDPHPHHFCGEYGRQPGTHYLTGQYMVHGPYMRQHTSWTAGPAKYRSSSTERRAAPKWC